MYGAGALLARIATQLAPANSESKLWRSLSARKALLARVTATGRAVRTASRPLVWMHAPSVGEGLQARPVAHRLRTLHPELQLAYTFFSPSAERFAKTIGADITDYLPFDGKREADAMLDAIQPSVLVFVKLDVWPMLVERAAARDIPVLLLSGTVAPRSGRSGILASLALRGAYESLQSVGAIDHANANRLRALGVRPDVLEVTGDTRFDQVWARAQGVDRGAGLVHALASDRPTLVAGSTWPADEATLFASWLRLKAEVPWARLVIAPHEPTTAHMEPIRRWVVQHGLAHATLSDVEHIAGAAERDVILVERTGVLGDIYAVADVAFVGGGFHAAGLHSVIEPAAYGVPVIFGPQHDMSREAGLLITEGAAQAVADEHGMSKVFREWFGDRATRLKAGAAARAVVQRELGATERSVQLIQRILRTQL